MEPYVCGTGAVIRPSGDPPNEARVKGHADGMITDRGKPKYGENKLYQLNCAHDKFEMDYPVHEPGPAD